MEKLWAFFENLDEYVYAADADTHELLYLNRKLRDVYGLSSNEELSGHLCHELLQDSALPCTMCNNGSLEMGRFAEWRYYNPIIGRSLLIRDTLVNMDGRRVRVELAMDASKQELRSAQLVPRRDLAATVNEGLRVALQAEMPDQSLNIVLEFLGKALQGKRAFIFEQDQKGVNDNTYEWVAKGMEPEKDQLQGLPPERCAVWYREFSEGSSIILYDPEQIRAKDRRMFEDLKRKGVKTLVMVPLFDEKRAIGFFGVEDPPSEMLLDASNMLQITGHFIVSSIKRRDLVRQLQMLSYHDQLTGIGNRHAMWKFVKQLCPSESLGVVYCDVTGLKQVNDTQGHEAGDRLIVRCCRCLEQVFGKEGIFRIGGDELLALLPGVREIELRERVEALREEIQEHSTTLAIGAVWHKDGSGDFSRLLSEAEHLMYQDKADYYLRTGLDRRGS